MRRHRANARKRRAPAPQANRIGQRPRGLLLAVGRSLEGVWKGPIAGSSLLSPTWTEAAKGLDERVGKGDNQTPGAAGHHLSTVSVEAGFGLTIGQKTSLELKLDLAFGRVSRSKNRCQDVRSQPRFFGEIFILRGGQRAPGRQVTGCFEMVCHALAQTVEPTVAMRLASAI